jgi:glycosyltransferase involved in cell wall biosynthesis
MKILQINTSDIQGGAARAAYRIHKGLQAAGIQSHMLVQSKKSDDNSVIGPSNKFNKVLSLLRPTLDASVVKLRAKGSKTIFYPAWLPYSGISSQIDALSPDIVHLQWICGGMLRIEEIKKIKKPLVWTLQDMWAFTGGCHYSDTCERFQQCCGECPQLKRKGKNDLSHAIFKRKEKAWHDINLTIVTISQWLADCARKSSLFAQKRIEVIPNGLDTDHYQVIDKALARQIWHLPQNRKLILFGAISATKDPRKGFHFIQSALQQLPWRGKAELVVFGAIEPENPPDLGLPIHYLGHLHDDVSLALLYSAADVMLVPSKQEAFGQTASESMSCGTPVVAFGATGLLDIVDHKQNGYLAQPFESNDLARGIEWVLADEERYKQLCHAAREKAVTHFDIKKVAKQYVDLYQSLL